MIAISYRWGQKYHRSAGYERDKSTSAFLLLLCLHLFVLSRKDDSRARIKKVREGRFREESRMLHWTLHGRFPYNIQMRSALQWDEETGREWYSKETSFNTKESMTHLTKRKRLSVHAQDPFFFSIAAGTSSWICIGCFKGKLAAVNSHNALLWEQARLPVACVCPQK